MHDAMYIDGRWRAAASGATLPVVNPADERVFDRVPAGDQADVREAVAAARRAFEGPWRETSARQRSTLLHAIAAGIHRRKDELARLEVADNGKPLPEALWDIDDAARCFDYYASLALEIDTQQDAPVALPDDRFASSVRREPTGVAGLIVPWNYPLLMATWKVAPALAAGCSCVLKPSELTSLTALELARIAAEAGVPAGVLNVVTGIGTVAGQALCAHPEVDKLAFTGSVATGRAVMMAAAQDIKRVSLELGGKSPLIVFADADIDEAVEWIMFGVFWNQGEVCSATSRVLIERPIAAAVINALVERVRAIRIGDGLAEGTLLGPLVSAAHRDKVLAYIDEGRRAGARILCGGGKPPQLPRGYFVEPTIFDRVTDDMRIWREEIFGPVLCVDAFDREDEAIGRANATSYGLAAAVMSRDDARCNRVAKAFRAGVVWINCSQPTFSQAPWGGMKRSGIGRELGRWGLDNYLEVKQVTRYCSAAPWGWYRKP